jgi:hypothetical protein
LLSRVHALVFANQVRAAIVTGASEAEKKDCTG